MKWNSAIAAMLCLGLAACTQTEGDIAEEFALSPDAPNVDLENPAVQEVLAIRDRAATALQQGDAETFAAGIDEGFVASNPADQLARKEAMVAFVANAELRYTGIDTVLAFAQQVAPDIVVLMGNEFTTQSSVPDDATSGQSFVDSRLNRRFTDVYRRGEDGVWRHLAKQSTLVGSEPLD